MFPLPTARTYEAGLPIEAGIPGFQDNVVPVIRGTGVDPTRSTDRRDSLLNGRKHAKRKCGLIFEFWKIRPKGGTVLLWSRHLLLSLFLNGENQVRTKNPNDSSMEKKVVCEN